MNVFRNEKRGFYGLRSHQLLLLFGCVLLFPFLWANAETKSLLILHTNDMHDHVRPGYEGCGGLPYIAGYIESVKKERGDVLAVDAGDFTEKGDMVAFKSGSKMIFEFLDRIGYDAFAFGNHDVSYGANFLRERVGGLKHAKALCLNYLRSNGTPNFTSSAIFKINGIRVGVIGVTLPKEGEVMTFNECGRAVETEARRIEENADLLMVVGHIGSKSCSDMASLAPSIQVFIGGHTHEALQKPVVAESSGALIVQAGEYAQYVGRLELAVDLDYKKIVSYKGSLVKMEQATIPCDADILKIVRDREQELCPEAVRIIAKNDKPIQRAGAALFSAEAIRRKTQADIGFCHPGQVIRSGFPVGDLDLNAFFLTGAQRGGKLVVARLTGEEIAAYLANLMTDGKGQTQWCGMHANVNFVSSAGKWTASTDLDPKKTYTVAMPEIEWNTRYTKVVDASSRAAGADSGAGAAPSPFSFTDAIDEYAESIGKANVTVNEELERLAKETGAVLLKAEK
jgi:2',3'-cyclic-nucleotide 2'-phosphodiesterase (5'-nucleotidase family)